MHATGRDQEILHTLTQRVRFLSLDQIARTWWADSASSRDTARRRLSRLVHGGALERASINIHPELPLAEPLYRWRPGEGTPDFGAVAYRLQRRWTEAPRPTLIYLASSRSARLLGGVGGRLKRHFQTTHDLHVGTLYLRILRERPEEAKRWLSEERLAPTRRRQKLPDAAIAGDDGTPCRVIEFGGAYDRAHVQAFHEDCAARALPYEMW